MLGTEAPPTPPEARSRRTRRRSLVGVAAVLVAAAALAAGLLLPGAGRRLAPFHLAAPTGAGTVSYTPPPAGQGTPTVLAFFASWCPPCHTELPELAAQARILRQAGSPIRFVGIDGNESNPADGAAFAQKAGVGFPVGEDPNQAVANQLGLQGLPDTVFVDRSGHVVHVMAGSGFSAAQFRHWASVISG